MKLPDYTVAAAELLAAADHLRAVGLYQGGLYFAPLAESHSPMWNEAVGAVAEADASQRPCCALGALAVAMDAIEIVLVDPKKAPTQDMRDYFHSSEYAERHQHFLDMREAVEETLHATKKTNRHLTAWNDHQAADAEEVAGVLEATAARLQALGDAAEAAALDEVPC